MACAGLRHLRPEEPDELVAAAAGFSANRQHAQQRESTTMIAVGAEHELAVRTLEGGRAQCA